MSQDSPQSTVYELRRQQRGAEPPRKAGSWKRKALFSLGALVGTIGLGVAFWVHWDWTHVRMNDVQVMAAVRRVPAEQDGRVKELLVEPGDAVKVGQVLMRLDDTELQAQLAGDQAQEASKESLLAQAQAQLSVTEATVEANIASAQLDVAAAQAGVSNAQAQEGEAKAQLDKLLAGARPEDIEAAEARVATAKAMEKLDALEVTQSEQLVKQGIDSEHMLEVTKTTLTTQKNTVREAELALALLKAGPTDEDKRIAEQKLAAAQAGLSLAKVQLQQAQAGLERAQAMKAQIKLGQQQVNAAQADLRNAQEQVKAARVAISQTIVTSQYNGTVIATYDKVGEYCHKGVRTMLVTDDSRGRWIEGYVSERDAERVKPGQKVTVEVVIGSGQWTQAVVEDVSSATNSVSDAGTASGNGMAPGAGYGIANQVWVRLRLLTQNQHWLPGSTARATIYTP